MKKAPMTNRKGAQTPLWNSRPNEDHFPGSYTNAAANGLTSNGGGTYASRAAAQGTGTLDLSDFPALGSGTSSNAPPPVQNNYPDLTPQQPGAFVQAAKAGLYRNTDGTLTPGQQPSRPRVEDPQDEFPSLQSAHKVSIPCWVLI